MHIHITTHTYITSQALQLVFTTTSSSATDLLPLAQSLETNTRLRSLSIPRNKLQDQGATLISNALLHNRTLEYLDISGNRILKDGMRALCDSLSRGNNSGLRDLNLGCLYDEESQNAVSCMLRNNSTLRSLSVSLNSSSDGACACACVVISALTHNSTLRNLSILGQACGSSTLTTLAQILRENIFLIHFEVSLGGNVTQDALMDVGDALRQTPRYHVVHVKGVPLTRVRSRLQLPERPSPASGCHHHHHHHDSNGRDYHDSDTLMTQMMHTCPAAWGNGNNSVMRSIRRPLHHGDRPWPHDSHDRRSFYEDVTVYNTDTSTSQQWTDESIVLHLQAIHHEKILGFAMGQHARLGEQSHVRWLKPDSICMVALYYFSLPLGYFDDSL